MAAAHATRRREGGERGRAGAPGAEGAASSPARTPRPKPVVATRRTRDVRLYAGCAGARTRTRTRTRRRRRRGGRRGGGARRREGRRGGRWRGGTPRRRGVLGAPRDARPLGGRRRRARRDGAGARDGAETASGVAVAARATILSLNLPERTRASERGWTREGDSGERRRERSTLRFDLFRRGKRASCDPPRGMPRKEWRPRRRQCDYRYREISRAGPTRQVLLSSWWQRLRRMSRIFLGPGESREPLNSRMTVCFASIADRGSPTGFRTVMRVAVERARTCRTDGCRVARCVAGHFFRSRI